MNNQPNDLVTLEWLMPLLNEQLARLHECWQYAEGDTDLNAVARDYHQLNGVLQVANLTLFARLAMAICQLTQEICDSKLDWSYAHVALHASELLHHELNHYALTGLYRRRLLAKRIAYLERLLLNIRNEELSDTPNSTNKVEVSHTEVEKILSETMTSNGNSEYDVLLNLRLSENIQLPKFTQLKLSKAQRQQLLTAWRYQIQKLLAVNTNQPETLDSLQTVSQYLYKAAIPTVLQSLWYVSGLWFDSLSHNDLPKPQQYAHLLAELDSIIPLSGSPLSEAEASWFENVLADIYIQLSTLKHINEPTQQLLVHLHDPALIEQAFFPRILNELEQLIFQLDNPKSIIEPLQEIKWQLARRGWSFYVSYIEQILSDIQMALESKEVFQQIRWQIERQLQELYGEIYNTHETISAKVGDTPTAFTDGSSTQNADASTDQPVTPNGSHAMPSSSKLRQVRIIVEELKHAFNGYLQQHNAHLLEKPSDFNELTQAFQQMELPQAAKTTEKLSELFTAIAHNNLTHINWQLTDALADILAILELFLDRLAQQTLDHKLLAKSDNRLTDAQAYLDELLNHPDLQETLANQAKTAQYDKTVTRYDDTGEIEPSQLVPETQENLEDSIDIADAAFAIEKASQAELQSLPAQEDEPVGESEALIQAREALKDDDFSMDEEIREIFIEEAGEVLEQMDEFLPVWQKNPQDLTPLTEIRRGFHTLKGSGRMVGAHNTGEMAWAVENMLNRVLDKTLEVSDELVQFIVETKSLIPILVKNFEDNQPPEIDPAITVLKAQNLLHKRPINEGLALTYQAKTAQSSDAEHIHATQATSQAQAETAQPTQVAPTSSSDISENQSIQLPEVLAPFIEEAKNLPEDDKDADPDIKEIFIEEAREVLAEITPLFEKWQANPTDLALLTDVRRGFHTLKGSGRMVGANQTGELAWSIENMLNRVLDHSILVNDGIIALVSDVLSTYPSLVDTFEAGQDNYPETMITWVACANAYAKKQGDTFDYQDIASAHQDKKNDDITPSSITNPSEIAEVELNQDNLDDALRSITSVNQMMADTNVVVTQPETEEEQQFVEIFIEEAKERLATIKNFLQQHQDGVPVEVSDDIVRAFHTLRGASGSKALTAISEVSSTIEHSLEFLQQHDALMNLHHIEAMSKSVELIESYLSAYDIHSTHVMPDDEKNQKDINELQALLTDNLDTDETPETTLSVATLISDDIDDLLDAEWEAESQLSTDSQQVSLYAEVISSQIQILLSRVGDSKKFQTLLNALLNVYQLLIKKPKMSENDDIVNSLIAGHEQLTGLFDALAGSMSLRLDKQVIAQLETIALDNAIIEADVLDIEPIETDIELLEIFLEEAQELDTTISETFAQWKEAPADTELLKALQRYLHTIKGGARMAGIHSIGDLTHEAENIYESFVEGRMTPSQGWITVMQGVQDTLSLQIEYVAKHQQSFFVKDIITALQEFAAQGQIDDDASIRLPVIDGHANEDTSSDDSLLSEEDDDTQIIDLQRMIRDSWQNNPPDPDILAVFLEEAEELVESSTTHLQAFRSNTSDLNTLQALQRELHTIKGGARMVSANGIADLSHQMETVYEDLGSRRRPATKMVSQLLTSCHDWLANAVFLLTHNINPPTPTPLINALTQFSHNPDSLQQVPNVSLQSYIDAIYEYEEYQKSQQKGHDISQMPPMSGNFGQNDEQAVAANEMIRISADLMERMINLSGESAINRARIDMGITSLTNSIEEMGVTVQRLADQLRRMDNELEEQILAQISDNELLENEEFDPLEMDQYSSLNQLSKSLSESASDLLDIKTTLLEKTRDSENLLLQLSRTQNELQDGLMNSRIVPFSRLTPRLQRIVRQTANELHKSVELVIINADDEMDRTILERITSPLEHMLRNAVDHGIESAQERAHLGKDRVGRITLEISREGSEIVINLTDDGSGIDVEAVRKKAISQGLIDPKDDSLTDVDVMQYIFNAGLTTTKKVTQISGRGVGMDVVRSEIRQLGGNVAVDSIAGKGSRFTMRVPLTVAVSDALVVRAADRYYAIPLVQIERVVRINPEELFDYHQSDSNTFNIDGIDYRLRYLNEILSGHMLNELTVSTNTSLPVIIIKNQMGQHLALQVDEINGSRIEVVVKPLGPQLSHVAGISAATIMGDGSVMLILDLMALMRNAPPKEASQAKQRVKNKRPTILVVDDSVTVRKVTSRFLERQGFDAIVAKDGVDAIEMLQELTPDLILLDIEMPRMDGFEVATQVRHNNRLHDTPIIMITSRTGEKHRERAMEIGVNDYMGKPFQENQLLNRIQKWLGMEMTEHHGG